MNKQVKLNCQICSNEFLKDKREFDRSNRVGRTTYCGYSCAAIANNKEKKAKEAEAFCSHCRKLFKTTTKAKASEEFCSRSCASAGSMTEEKREAQRLSGINTENLITMEAALKIREAWRYVEIKEYLESKDIEHEFEYRVENFIYDLHITKKRILIEFDEKHHRSSIARKTDELKTDKAEELGYLLLRQNVETSSIIPVSTISGFL